MWDLGVVNVRRLLAFLRVQQARERGRGNEGLATQGVEPPFDGQRVRLPVQVENWRFREAVGCAHKSAWDCSFMGWRAADAVRAVDACRGAHGTKYGNRRGYCRGTRGGSWKPLLMSFRRGTARRVSVNPRTYP